MTAEEIIRILKKAIIRIEYVEIVTKNNKKYIIIPSEINEKEGKLYYFFQNNLKEGQIHLNNIIECKGISLDEKKRIDLFKENYLQIVNTKKGLKEDVEDEIEFKNDVYVKIFENIKEDKTNLLYQYIMDCTFDEKEVNSIPVLLLQQSNISQKRAIKKAIEHRVSIIEGPPGTGKTTTIQSIIANMIVQDKKVVVVSKNNSAIENIVDELNKMAMPRFYVRLGNRKQKIWKVDSAIDAKERFKKELENIKQQKQKEDYINLDLLESQILEKEEQLNELVKHKNLLSELKNQYRHVQKLENSYSFQSQLDWKTQMILKRKKINEKSIDKLATHLIKIEKEEIDYKEQYEIIKKFQAFLKKQQEKK